MLTRKYSVVSILKDMFREKAIVIVVVIICAGLGAVAGYVDYKNGVNQDNDLANKIASEPIEGEEDYITQLRNYEDALAECEDAIALAEEQRDNLQSYIDNSILMKINPNEVKVAYASFVVQDTANAGNILNSIQSYINEGGLKEDALSQGAEDLNPEGWREIISVGITGNNLFITISHYDSDQVQEIMNVVKKCLEMSKESISKTQGDYNLALTDESFYTKMDGNIANTQNNNNNNLKSYTNSVADQLNKYNGQAKTVSDFKEKNEIAESKSAQRGLKKNLMLFSAAGFIGGLMLSFAILAIKAVVSDKIVCSDHLRYAGLVIFNEYLSKKKEFKTDIKETIGIIERNAKKAGIDKTCIYAIGDSENNKVISEVLKKNLAIEACGNEKIYDCDQVVAVLTERKNRYSEIEVLLEKCAQNNIDVIGFVVCK